MNLYALTCTCPQFTGELTGNPGMCSHLMVCIMMYGEMVLRPMPWLEAHGYIDLLRAYPKARVDLSDWPAEARPALLALFAAFIIHRRRDSIAQMLLGMSRPEVTIGMIHRLGDTHYYRVPFGPGHIHNVSLYKPGCDCPEFQKSGWCEALGLVVATQPVLAA